jgi:hypothetical protein
MGIGIDMGVGSKGVNNLCLQRRFAGKRLLATPGLGGETTQSLKLVTGGLHLPLSQ